MTEPSDDLEQLNWDPPAVFGAQENLLHAKLDAGRAADHSVIHGTGVEIHWREMLKAFLPRRYDVCTGIVVDSGGHKSEQIDVIIRDANFSPAFWEYGGSLYLPVESVYAVLEIRPKIDKANLLYASQKARSVRRLKRNSAPIEWAAGTLPPKEHRKILGGMLALRSAWSQPFGEPFQAALADLPTEGVLDIGCALTAGSFDVAPEDSEIELSPPERTLIWFALRLVRRLQAMGTVPAIDFDVYSTLVC